MKVLLDTHVWLWALLEPERLPDRAAAVLSEPGTELYLSPVSVWETLVLAERGRLRLEPSAETWVERALEASPVRDAPLDRATALATARVDLPHRDPADRFLAATAAAHGLRLLTADRRLLAGRGFPVLPA